MSLISQSLHSHRVGVSGNAYFAFRHFKLTHHRPACSLDNEPAYKDPQPFEREEDSMRKTYDKPTLVKRQKLSAVTAQEAVSNGPVGPAG
jgi:hypothetical protein